MFSGLAAGAKSLGLRFTVSGLLPFIVLSAFGFAIAVIMVAGPNTDPLDALSAAGEGAGWAGLAVGLVAAFTFAVVTQPFQIGLVRLLEGYWGVGGHSAQIRSIGVERQRRQRRRLQLALHRAEDAGELEDAAALGARIGRYPPPEELLPTGLGNALRAGERRAGERYGLDTVAAWARLFYLLPEPFQRDVAELHGQVDGSARLSASLFLAGAASAPVLVVHGWWNLVWLTACGLSVVAYRAGIAAATTLTVVLCSAFDLHRFSLIGAMHLPMPNTHAQELEQARVMDRLWEYSPEDDPINIRYAHPAAGQPASAQRGRRPTRRQDFLGGQSG